MKKLLVLVALGTVIAAPAFAQREPNTDYRVRSPQQQRSTVPPGGIYYERNGNANPDSQLSGDRWKTNKAKHVRHHRSVKKN